MKRILTTTALALTMGGAAYAQSTDATTGMDSNSPFVNQGGEMNVEMRASDVIGMRVYTSAETIDATEMSSPADSWNDVGEVNDVLLARDGSIEAILLDIGGFLGIGEKQVAVRMDQLRFVTDGDTDGDFFVVFAADQAALENAPEYDASTLYGWLEQETEENAAAMNEEMQGNDGESTDMAASSDMNAEAEGENTDMAASTDMNAEAEGENADMAASTDMNAEAEGESTDMAASTDMNAEAEGETTDMAATDTTDSTMSDEGYAAADMTALTSEEITGTPAFDQNGERVGEVSQLLIDQEEITDVVIDFGGFLGIGEKSVRLPIADVNIERNSEDQNLRVTVNVTQQEIEQMEEFEG